MIYHEENLSFQILSADRYTHLDGTFCIRRRSFSALSYRECGEGEFRIGKTHFVSRPGDVIFIPAGADYCAEYTGGSSLVVHMISCNYSVAEHISGVPFLAAAFRETVDAWKTTHSVNAAKASVYGIFQSLSEWQRAGAAAPETACALAFMKTHYTDCRLSVQEAASVAHISASTLRRRFIDCLGQTPKQYLEKLRLKEALRLLLRGDSIKEVAAACGFSDEKYFSRAIKKQYGLPPSAFRP